MLNSNIESITRFVLSLCDGDVEKKLTRAFAGGKVYDKEIDVVSEGIYPKECDKKIYWGFHDSPKNTNYASLNLGFIREQLIIGGFGYGITPSFFSSVASVTNKLLVSLIL